MIHPDPKAEYFAEAQFKGPHNAPEDDYLAWGHYLIPLAKTNSPGHVASHLRFGGLLTGQRAAAIHLGGAALQCHGAQNQR